MDDFKEQFKKDFEESSNTNLSFDTTQLEPNSRKSKHKIKPYKLGLIVTAAVILGIIAVPASLILFSSLKIEESVKTSNRRYSLNEIRIAESNTFKKLNTVSYPDGGAPSPIKTTEEESKAYNNFSNLTYHALVDTSKKDNMSYSVVGLYSMINEMTNATSREELKEKFNTLLGLNEGSRVTFYDKVMKANSFASDESTIQLKNSAFFNNEFNYNQEFVNSLTKLYCEAYQINFESEASKMVEWVNQAVNSNGFIDDKFLEINDETQLYLFSTLYFKNAWASKYLSENKQMIIHQLYEMYTQPLTSVVLASELSKINRYGIIIRMFQSSNMKMHEYIYDFFDLLINEKKVKEIINKYLNFSINRRIMSNIKVDELINFINESKCFVRNKFNLYKLYKYIDMKEKMNVFQKENINKP